MAAGTSRSVLFISTTSAASMATSAPAPMAMPVSARGEGGCIVDAVADHGDQARISCSSRMTASLPPGSTPATTSSTPASLPMAAAVRALSPVSMTTRMPMPRSWRMASGLLRLDGVRHGDEAEEPAVLRETAAASCLPARARLPALPFPAGSASCEAIYRTLPPEQLRAKDRRLQTAAGDGGEILRGLRLDLGFLAALHDGRGQRMLAPGLERRRRPAAAPAPSRRKRG